MAVIINDPKQIEALNEIQQTLKELKTLDSFIQNESITLCRSSGKAKRELSLPKVEQDRIRRILVARKDRLSKEVLWKASKNQIKLEASDKAILSPVESSEGKGGLGDPEAPASDSRPIHG